MYMIGMYQDNIRNLLESANDFSTYQNLLKILMKFDSGEQFIN